MLCTPPAFILSQDQTLYCCCIYPRFISVPLIYLYFRALILASLLCFKRIVEFFGCFFPFPSYFFPSSLYSVLVLCTSFFCCSIFKDRLFVSASFSRRLCYITTSDSLCQALFRLSFALPIGNFSRSRFSRERSHYIISFCLCQPFFSLFFYFFVFLRPKSKSYI